MVWSWGRHIWKLSKEPLYLGWHYWGHIELTCDLWCWHGLSYPSWYKGVLWADGYLEGGLEVRESCLHGEGGFGSLLWLANRLSKNPRFLLKARSCFLAAHDVACSDAFFTRLCNLRTSRKPLGSDRKFLCFSSLSVSFTVALCLWVLFSWLLCDLPAWDVTLKCSR